MKINKAMKKKLADKIVSVKKDESLKPMKLDKLVLRYMFLNGGISHKILIEKFGYTEKKLRRFKKLSHHNVIKEVEECEDGTVKSKYIYTLSGKGVEFGIKEGWRGFAQHYNGYEHTLKAEEVLYKLINEKNVPIESIINENTQKELFAATIQDAKQTLRKLRNSVKTKEEKKKIGNISIVDFIYKDSETKEYVAYEVVTSSYKEHQKLNHRNYAKYVLGIDTSSRNYNEI